MIYTKIRGGLGNQLFQYAFARTLANRHGTDILFDLSWYRHFPQRRFELEHFNISGRPATLLERARMPFLRHAVEQKRSFSKELLQLPDSVVLDGTWQSERYFMSIEPLLRKELNLKETTDSFRAALSGIPSGNSVSLHIRRGDYMSPKVQATFGILPLSYYERAANYIAEQTSSPPMFVIFSDDIAWAHKHLQLPYQMIFIEQQDSIQDYEELFLMAACKHHIIANSTFSWWGAWLNPKSEKIVSAPKQWLVNISADIRDMVPEEWARF